MIALLALVTIWQGGTGYKLETRYPVPGNGGFDYVTIDSDARRLYLSHSTQVDVVDPDNGKLIGTIADTPGVHGVAIAPGVQTWFHQQRSREQSLDVRSDHVAVD